MKKEKNILMALAMFASVSAFADNEESVVIYGAGGQIDNTVELAKIRKITFSDDGFTVVAKDGSTLPCGYATTKSIKFKDLVNGIQTVNNDAGNQLSLHFDGQSVWADGAQGVQGTVYGVNGQQLVSVRMDGSRVSVENLPKGVYVFKVGDKSIKFAK